MFLATNLTANQQYTFMVIPFNAAGQGTGVVGGDPTTGEAVTVGSASAAGWYKVSFNDPSDPTATSESITLGGTAFTDVSGTLSLANNGWIEADSEAQAVQEALTGWVTSHDNDYDVNNTFVFGQSGAFQYNPDLQLGGTDIGPAEVMEDEFNEPGHGDHNYTDVYVPLNVAQGALSVFATADQTAVVSGHPIPYTNSLIGFVQSADPASTASDFSTTIAWPDSAARSCTLTAIGNGSFMASVALPTGETLSSYTLSVTQTATGLWASDSLENGVPTGGVGDGLPRLVGLGPVTPLVAATPPSIFSVLPVSSSAMEVRFIGGPADTAYAIYACLASQLSGGKVKIASIYLQSNATFEETSKDRFAFFVPNLNPSTTYYFAVVGGRKTSRAASGTSSGKTDPMAPDPITGLQVALAGGRSIWSVDYGDIHADDPSESPAPEHDLMPQQQVLSWDWDGAVSSGVSFEISRHNTADGSTVLLPSVLATSPLLGRNGSAFTYTDGIALADTPDPGIYQYSITVVANGNSSKTSARSFAPQVYYVEGRTEGISDPTDPDTTGEEIQTYYGSDQFPASGDPKVAAELHFFVYQLTPQNNVQPLLNAFDRQGGGPVILMGFSNGGWASKLVSDTGVTINYLALFDPVPDPTVDPVPDTIALGPNVLAGHDWYYYNATTDPYATRPMSSVTHPELGDSNHNTFGGEYHGSEILQQPTVDAIDSAISGFAGQWVA
jgi:hypothetical protein